jgi:hypothetical protein
MAAKKKTMTKKLSKARKLEGTKTLISVTKVTDWRLLKASWWSARAMAFLIIQAGREAHDGGKEEVEEEPEQGREVRGYEDVISRQASALTV